MTNLNVGVVKTPILIFIGVTIIFTINTASSASTKAKKVPVTLPPSPEELKMTECKAAVSQLMKKSLQAMIGCRGKVATIESDARAKMTCMGKCIFITEGILSPEGLISKDTAETYASKEVPEILRPAIGPVMKPCFAESQGKLDPNDPTCKSYEPFVKCVMDSLPQLCNNGTSDNPYKF